MSNSPTTMGAGDPLALAQLRRAPSHPGAILADLLRDAGVGQAEAARRMGMSANRLNEIRLGKRAMTPVTCVLVAALTRSSPELWATLQMRHDVWHALRDHRAAAQAIAPLVEPPAARRARVSAA